MLSITKKSFINKYIRPITTWHWTNNNKRVEIITNPNDSRCNEIFKLRYQVMSEQTPNSPFNENHPMVYLTNNGYEIKDRLDSEPSTVQYALKNSSGRIVSAIRTVDGNKSQLDMEKYGWFNIPEYVKEQGVVEWGRLVSCK